MNSFSEKYSYSTLFVIFYNSDVLPTTINLFRCGRQNNVRKQYYSGHRGNGRRQCEYFVRKIYFPKFRGKRPNFDDEKCENKLMSELIRMADILAAVGIHVHSTTRL